MNFDPLSYPYTSQRRLVYGRKGMVASSQPLAAQAGLEMLRRGGNAIDAAIATAACLTVVEPTGNGIGSDAFAIVYKDKKIYGLNSSGPAPFGISREALQERGCHKVPKFGVLPVTVPGAPAAWAALSKRFGRLSFAELLAPAIFYAQDGYPVSPVISHLWKQAMAVYQKENLPEMAEWFHIFAPGGKTPAAGELWRSPDHAKTLQLIAETEARAFYEGELAEKIEAFVTAHGGYLTKKDLCSFAPAWVDPVRTEYRGFDIWELPPNGQGLVVLMALNILRPFSLADKPAPERLHLQIEAIKLALTDGLAHITDPRSMKVPVDWLLSESYARKRRQEIGAKAALPAPGNLPAGGTVYLAAADGEGNMVSFIQSNFAGFGSGVVIPGTGISLQNRGNSFSLDEGASNVLRPGKRTYHTIIPGFITQNNEAVGPFGIMGGYVQPQAHVQFLTNLLDMHDNPQAALDAPRWQWIMEKKIKVEHHFPTALLAALQKKGHEIEICSPDDTTFGRGQAIFRDAHGVLLGATEPRTDGGIGVL
jgi:gamma-glutamyltranspeptidase / glutathione hydrolase